MHRHAGSRSAYTRSRPASGRRPNTAGNHLRWRTLTGIRARSSEMKGVAPNYTTSCGRLKQPDKQKLAKTQLAQVQPTVSAFTTCPILRCRTESWVPVYPPPRGESSGPNAFVEGKLEAPKHLARTVHDLYFEPKYEEFRPRTIKTSACLASRLW